MMKYKFSKTLEKFGITAIEVVIAGVISYFGNSPWWLVIAPLMEAVRNFIKHYDGK